MFRGKMLTGLSLSFCVRDILLGKVKLANVRKIIAETACKDEKDWNKVLLMYRQIYWSDNPEKGEKIARKLIKAGKVHQPRIEGKALPSIFKGWWKNQKGSRIVT